VGGPLEVSPPPADSTTSIIAGHGDVVSLAVVAEISAQLDSLELALALLDVARWRLAA
jgi:hypothetical protein